MTRGVRQRCLTHLISCRAPRFGIKKFAGLLRINEFVVGAGRAQLYAKLTRAMEEKECEHEGRGGGEGRAGRRGWEISRALDFTATTARELILMARARTVIAS